MLDNTVQGIELLAQDADQWQCPTLLDANAVDKFLEWLQNNPVYTGLLIDKTWRVAVLRHQIDLRPDVARIRKRLKAFQIQELRYDVVRNRMLVAELRRAYFGDQGNADQSAELLACGRQQSTDNPSVRIISRYRGFRLVPNIELYLVPTAEEIGTDSNAVFLRMFDEMKLHERVKTASEDLFKSGQYVLAIQQSSISFAKYVRQIGIDHSLPFKDVKNDQPMVDQALHCSEADASKNRAAKLPAIQLNDLLLPSEWSEQKGFHEIMKGAVSAVRNPTAHESADEQFLQKRFGDRRTALKFLCVLSLLFEKLDKRVAP